MEHEYEKQYREGRKKIIVLFVLFGIVSTYLNYDQNRNAREFYESKITARAIKQSDWLVHARTFYLSDGHSLCFMLSHEGDFVYMDKKFFIGDSVYKPENSTLFKVYRPNASGKYNFFKEYDNNKTN